ncbi:hypothetical protein G9A89_004375 [Geosiphon pyriformis]|nr:hypothetical protein G9A89_004375 [Geosiphon pyriformis]
MKKTIKVSGSEGGFKAVASRKKKKRGVLAEGINNRRVAAKASGVCLWGFETGDTTESKSIDIEKECLVEETSVDYGKPLSVINYGTVNTNDNVLDDFFLFPPSLPIKPSVQVPVHKSFGLDIDLVAIAEKSFQKKLSFIRKIFSSVNSFGGASTPSKFGEIIRVTFTLEKAMMAAGKLANDHSIVVNTNLKCSVNNHTNWAIVLKKISVETSIETVHAAVSVIIELEDQSQAALLAVEWSILIGKDAVCVIRADINKQTWDIKDKFRTLLYTLLIGTMAYDLWDFIGFVGHSSLVCKSAGAFSISKSKRALFSAQDKFRLAKIYKKKSAPVSRPLAFGGKTWVNVVGKFSFHAPSDSPFLLGSINSSKPISLVGSVLEICLVSIENSLINFTEQISELTKRLNSLILVVSQSSSRCELPVTPLSQIQEKDTVMRVGSGKVTSDETVMIVDLLASSHVVKLEKMLEGLFKSVLSLSVFTSGLNSGYLGAGVVIIMNFSLARHADVINSLITRAVNESSFVVLGSDFNEDGTHRCASFKKCLDLGLVNSLVGSQTLKMPTWANSKSVQKTIDFMFVSSNLVNALVHHNVLDVSEHFDMDHQAVSVSLSLGGLLDTWCATLNNATMFMNASEKFLDLDAMWEIIRKIMVFSANEVFNEVLTKKSSRFHKLELLVSRIIKTSCGEMLSSIITSSVDFGHVHSALLGAKKSYCASKLAESQCAKDANIRSVIDKRMESFEMNKGYTIRNMLEHSFHKVVLNYLVVDDELILESDLVRSKVNVIMEGWTRKCQVVDSVSDDWCHQYHPLEYVFDEVFSGVMNSVSFNKLFKVVSDLPDNKAAGLLKISNKLWKHCDKLVLDMFLVLLNFCLTGESVSGLWKETWILSKILSNRISTVCNAFNVLCGDNFLVLKGIITQSPIFAISSIDMRKAYDSVSWEHLEKSLIRIKMCSKFIQYFGSIYRDRTNQVITDFGLTNGYHVYDSLDQREVFSSLLWHIFYNPLLCKVKRQESVCGYRLNSYFVSKSGCPESQAGLSSFFAAGAFTATQHIFNVASEFFQVNDISINNDKTVAILINSQVSSPFLSISSLPISIAKKKESHQYLGIFLSTEGLLRSSLAKAHLDIQFFVNLVLKKTVSDKQFLYLVSAVLQPIVSYQTQFSFVPVSICSKWDALIRKGLKLKSGFSLNFPSNMLYHPFFYGLKSFSQVAFLVSFVNSGGILGHLFVHRSHNLQVHFPVCVHVSAFNNFLVGIVHILLDCNLSLGGFLANSFWFCSSIPMFSILGELMFSRFLSSLWRFSVAFVDQLHNRHGAVFDWYIFKQWKRLNLCGPISEWFKLAMVFLNSVNSLPAGPLALDGAVSLNILDFDDFVSIHDCFSCVESSDISVYIDGSLKNLGTTDCRAGAVAFFENIGLGLGVGVSGLMSSTLAELQTITLALECVPASSSVQLFSDSQSVLDACKSELSFVYPDFCNQCWVERRHIANIIRYKNLSVNWHKVEGHSGISGNEHADLIAGAASLSGWHLIPCLDEHFIVANNSVVSENSKHFVCNIYHSICCAYWEVDFGSKFLANSLLSEVDWPCSSLVWHSDLHMATSFTSKPLVGIHTYFMKTLHHQLPVAVWKCFYNRHYLGVLCLYCGELLSSCVSDFSVSIALYKGFVFNGWFREAVSIFYDPKVAGLEIVKFVRSFGLAFRDNIWLV